MQMNIEAIWNKFEAEVFLRELPYSNFCKKVCYNMISEAIKNQIEISTMLEDFDSRFIESAKIVTQPDYIEVFSDEIDNIYDNVYDDVISYVACRVSDIFESYDRRLSPHLSDKIRKANINDDLMKLYKLTIRLWDEHKIILLNSAECSGSSSWAEATDTYDEYKHLGVKGVIGWWHQDCLMPSDPEGQTRDAREPGWGFRRRHHPQSRTA
jgi:hypothetical protein